MNASKYKLLLLPTVVVFFIVFYEYVWQRQIPLMPRISKTRYMHKDVIVNKNIINGRRIIKEIVMLNPPYWMFSNVTFSNCLVTNCIFRRGLTYLNSSDAVILYAKGFTKLPKRTKPGQVWIFAVWEPPTISSSQVFSKPEFHNQINWTMTYRLDSDIVVPYGVVKKIKRGYKINYTNLVSRKKKLVAWVVLFVHSTVFNDLKSLTFSLHIFKNILFRYFGNEMEFNVPFLCTVRLTRRVFWKQSYNEMKWSLTSHFMHCKAN